MIGEMTISMFILELIRLIIERSKIRIKLGEDDIRAIIMVSRITGRRNAEKGLPTKKQRVLNQSLTLLNISKINQRP